MLSKFNFTFGQTSYMFFNIVWPLSKEIRTEEKSNIIIRLNIRYYCVTVCYHGWLIVSLTTASFFQTKTDYQKNTCGTPYIIVVFVLNISFEIVWHFLHYCYFCFKYLHRNSVTLPALLLFLFCFNIALLNVWK